jgi:succinate dehydrogenase / fumarate reductase cytochrome b subunit
MASATKPIRRQRPLSPHLTVYRFYPTMVMSIVHRITGGALYFGTVLVAWWLIAAASGEAYFDWVNWFFGTIVGRLILFGYTWALLHHMVGGIRHFIWDTGPAVSTKPSSCSSHDLSHRLAGRRYRRLGLTVLIWVRPRCFWRARRIQLMDYAYTSRPSSRSRFGQGRHGPLLAPADDRRRQLFRSSASSSIFLSDLRRRDPMRKSCGAVQPDRRGADGAWFCSPRSFT